jgi:hypothetical protein
MIQWCELGRARGTTVPQELLSFLIGMIIERRHEELSALIGTVAQLLDVFDRECSERVLSELSSALMKLLAETDYASSGSVMTIGRQLAIRRSCAYLSARALKHGISLPVMESWRTTAASDIFADVRKAAAS